MTPSSSLVPISKSTISEAIIAMRNQIAEHRKELREELIERLMQWDMSRIPPWPYYREGAESVVNGEDIVDFIWKSVDFQEWQYAWVDDESFADRLEATVKLMSGDHIYLCLDDVETIQSYLEE